MRIPYVQELQGEVTDHLSHAKSCTLVGHTLSSAAHRTAIYASDAGNANVAKIVCTAAAQHLTPVTLEVRLALSPHDDPLIETP